MEDIKYIISSKSNGMESPNSFANGSIQPQYFRGNLSSSSSQIALSKRPNLSHYKPMRNSSRKDTSKLRSTKIMATSPIGVGGDSEAKLVISKPNIKIESVGFVHLII